MTVANDVLVEKIQTGLTRNYVAYWTVKQAIKEAAQNIAYGAVKSGNAPNIYYDEENSMGVMEDTYTGFEKKHLYLGESEQRTDKDGLGNFGEGWKIFLLEMARKNLEHKVDTVGFSFFGKMEPTPHGTDVLVIHVVPNDRKEGTRVMCQVEKEDFETAITSFAVLSGIDEKYVAEVCMIPNRKEELWVNGVRIEQDDNTNPLDLYFSYNLKDRTLINRDRSQVNAETVYGHIKKIITSQPREIVDVIIKLALEGNTRQDIVRGPFFFNQNLKWVEAIAEAHGTTPDKLILPSNDPEIDKEAKYRGYKLIKLPSQWASELHFIGFKKASEVIQIKPSYNKIDPTRQEKQKLHQAKRDTKKALGLTSVKELPPIVIVDEIKEPNGAYEASGLYDRETKTIFLTRSVLQNQSKATKTLIHEAVHWTTGAGDNSEGFTKGFEDVIQRLLGYEPKPTFKYGNVEGF